ncbi:MAG: alpha/beta fold hydrolase [Myxococcales bacterium]
MILPLSALFAAGHALFRARGFAVREIDSGGRRILLYDRKGSGGAPPVLLLHGLGGSAASFALLATRLASASRRVLVLDLPGHGRNRLRRGEEAAGLVEQAQALGSVLAQVGEPAVLIGNSLGGALCLHAAVVAPERVRAVVGLSPAGAPLLDAERESVRDAFRGDLRAALEMPGRLYRRPPRLARLFARDLARHFAAAPVQRLLAQAGQQALTPQDLARIEQPVLILWGESDGILPASSVDWFRAHLRNGTVEVLPECGHLPQMEQRALVLARVRRFLAELA